MTIAQSIPWGFLAAAMLVQPGNAIPLVPITVPSTNGSMRPVQDVKLQYGVDDVSLVNVSLSMNQPTVLLEKIASISTVDCSSTSVAITFNNTASFASAAAQWVPANSLVFVTNHLGDCDTELERSFFLSKSVEAINSSLTLIASASKTSVNETAATAEILFSGIPQTVNNAAKRAISLDPSLTISDSIDIGSTTLYTYDPYVTVTANSASVSASVTLSGGLKYSISEGSLEELYIDFETSASADLDLTLDVTAPYSTSFSYTAASLSYDFVNLPGILTIGPELNFDIGVYLDVEAAVIIDAGAGVTLTDGLAHIDFRNSSESYSSGWIPTYTATANITEKAAVSVDPYVDLTVELAIEVLGGLLDLSIGLEAEPRINNEFTLTASQELSASDGFSQTDSGSCSQGLEIKSEFEFNLVAIVTQFWSDTIYSVTVPIVDECYSWL